MNQDVYGKAIDGIQGSTLLVGFYGGGNFGDELLYDVFADMFKSRNKEYAFLFQAPDMLPVWHDKADGPHMVDARSKRSVIKSMYTQRNYVFGGGGFWGRDFNNNLFAFTVLLFLFSLLPGKRLYLFGVGFYNSGGMLARFSAWLMAKRASLIIARDQQTYDNFLKYTRRVQQSRDAAFYIESCTFAKQDFRDVVGSSARKKLLVFLRGRYSAKNQQIIDDIMRRFSDAFEVVFYIYGPKDIRQEMADRLHAAQATVKDFDYKTVDLYLSMKAARHKEALYVIAPQYHVQLIAHLAGVAFLPVSYDHKTDMLHRQLGVANTVGYWEDTYLSSAAEWVGVR